MKFQGGGSFKCLIWGEGACGFCHSSVGVCSKEGAPVTDLEIFSSPILGRHLKFFLIVAS